MPIIHVIPVMVATSCRNVGPSTYPTAKMQLHRWVHLRSPLRNECYGDICWIMGTGDYPLNRATPTYIFKVNLVAIKLSHLAFWYP